MTSWEKLGINSTGTSLRGACFLRKEEGKSQKKGNRRTMSLYTSVIDKEDEKRPWK